MPRTKDSNVIYLVEGIDGYECYYKLKDAFNEVNGIFGGILKYNTIASQVFKTNYYVKTWCGGQDIRILKMKVKGRK